MLISSVLRRKEKNESNLERAGLACRNRIEAEAAYRIS